eukprot:3680897-Pleurochrysis_carterae.AAC.1
MVERAKQKEKKRQTSASERAFWQASEHERVGGAKLEGVTTRGREGKGCELRRERWRKGESEGRSEAVGGWKE